MLWRRGVCSHALSVAFRLALGRPGRAQHPQPHDPCGAGTSGAGQPDYARVADCERWGGHTCGPGTGRDPDVRGSGDSGRGEVGVKVARQGEIQAPGNRHGPLPFVLDVSRWAEEPERTVIVAEAGEEQDAATVARVEPVAGTGPLFSRVADWLSQWMSVRLIA